MAGTVPSGPVCGQGMMENPYMHGICRFLRSTLDDKSVTVNTPREITGRLVRPHLSRREMSTPLHRAAAFGVALLIGSASLAACGDDSDSGGSGGSGGSKADITAACSLDNPPTSAASAPPESAGGQASGKVGVILPDTTSSTRYELYDKPLLTKALTDAGITADVQNAQGDKNKF